MPHSWVPTGGEGQKTQAIHASHAYLILDKNYPAELRALFTKSGVDRLEFTYLPEEISDGGAEPNWNEQEVIGRWEPYQIYQGTSARSFSLTLKFLAEMNPIRDVVNKVNWLRSLKYPVYYKGISYRPPAVYFVWGDFINSKCLLKSAEPTYRAPWFVDVSASGVEYSLIPMDVDVSISLTEINDIPVSGPNVMAGKH